jgi:Bacterial TSP3 repeat
MTLKTHITAAALASLFGLGLVTPGFGQDVDTDGDGIPDTAEVLLGTDPATADTDGDGQNDLADAEATYLDNPITTAGAAAPFAIAEALVENNYDLAAKADATDHLELLVTNAGPTPLSGFSIYYTITDLNSGKAEGTFRALGGFEVPARGEARIHFDDAAVAGHFRANPNSIYATTEAAKTFSVTLAADGFAAVTVEIAKDAGGAEKAD